MTRPLRGHVLIVFPYPKRGGIERNFRIWREWLSSSEDVTRLVVITTADLAGWDLGETTIVRTRGGMFRWFVSYLGYLLRHRPDAVIAFQFGALAVAARAFGIDVWLRLSNDPNGANLERSWRRKLSDFAKTGVYRFASGLIANSEELARRVGHYNRNVAVVRNALPRGISVPSSPKWASESGELRRFLFVGRLAFQKNLAELLRGFAKAAHDGAKKWTLGLAGDGEQRAHLEALARALDIADRVTFLGWTEPVPYDAYQVLVLPSLYEGSPNALVEGVAHGLLPIITPFASGGREILAMLGGGVVSEGFAGEQIAAALNKATDRLPTPDGLKAFFDAHSYEANRAALFRALERP